MNLPRMSCAKVCPLHLRRFHVTCIYCRYRRAYKKQLNPKTYHHPSACLESNVASYTTIFLAVDNNRKFATLKGILLKKLMTIAEMLAN